MAVNVKLLLLSLLFINCAGLKDRIPIWKEAIPFNMPRVEIIKENLPGIILVGEHKEWSVWVTKWTRYVQFIYKEQLVDPTYVGKSQLVHMSKIIDIGTYYNLDGELKKVNLVFGPMAYSAHYLIEIRAWNNKGMWDPTFKDKKIISIVVEQGYFNRK